MGGGGGGGMSDPLLSDPRDEVDETAEAADVDDGAVKLKCGFHAAANGFWSKLAMSQWWR